MGVAMSLGTKYWRAQVVAWFDEINPEWRRYVKVTRGRRSGVITTRWRSRWLPYRRSLVGDLPNVPARVPEAGSADPPRSIHRSVQEINPTLFQFLAHRVDVVHAERELEPDPGVAGSHGRRLDEPVCLSRLQQVDERFAEPEHRRAVVLEYHRQLKDLLVEAFRRLQLLHEQRDCSDSRGPRSLFGAFPLSHVHGHFSSPRSVSGRVGVRPKAASINQNRLAEAGEIIGAASKLPRQPVTPLSPPGRDSRFPARHPTHGR